MFSKPKFENRKLKRPQLLYQAVQDEVKAYIIEHSLMPGDALPPETELAEQLGVSRNSVREAIKSLETLGIVEARTGAGLFVRNFSFDPLIENLAYGLMSDLKDLADMLEVRFHIEHSMIDQAVATVTDEQLQQFEAILERMRLAIEQGETYMEEDRLFHSTLWSNVRNRSVGKIVDVFWMIFSQARRHSSIPSNPDHAEIYQWHVAIVAALANQDVAAARVAMVNHYGNIQKILEEMRILKTGQPAPTGEAAADAIPTEPPATKPD
ncbi:MAG: FadR family transcriptional regulator [Caldilineaceae bacterium]|nr:FadR family transcriptional regulator [Caldilineaceae bacterium]